MRTAKYTVGMIITIPQGLPQHRPADVLDEPEHNMEIFREAESCRNLIQRLFGGEY